MDKKTLLLAAAAACVLGLQGCRSDSGEAGDSANPVIEAIMARRSVRDYEDRPVSREILMTLAECGVNAPNAMNAQLWEVRIVDDAGMIEGISGKYREANPDMVARDPNFRNMFRNAPALICIAVREDRDGLDAGLMGGNIVLAAQSMGLGTVCLGGPVRFLTESPVAADFMRKLDFSPDYRLLYIIGVGYPAESPDAKPRDLGKIRFVD